MPSSAPVGNLTWNLAELALISGNPIKGLIYSIGLGVHKWFFGSLFPMVQGFKLAKESTYSRVKCNQLPSIKTKLPSTAGPELGTAQPQLVL